jgi:hypothetical protein
MLDYGIYYEFIPLHEVENENPKVLHLSEVKIGQDYEMVITTSAGLWRYRLGDVIQFTNLIPFRFVITGRTKHFINAFGEELMIHNAETALGVACEKTHAVVNEFTVGPVFMSETYGRHEWIIEFDKQPNSEGFFIEILDRTLKELNSDYEAKRFNNYVLELPLLKNIPSGSFYNWIKSKGKLGGQTKVPRLCNDRRYLDDLTRFLE